MLIPGGRSHSACCGDNPASRSCAAISGTIVGWIVSQASASCGKNALFSHRCPTCSACCSVASALRQSLPRVYTAYAAAYAGFAARTTADIADGLSRLRRRGAIAEERVTAPAAHVGSSGSLSVSRAHVRRTDSCIRERGVSTARETPSRSFAATIKNSGIRSSSCASSLTSREKLLSLSGRSWSTVQHPRTVRLPHTQTDHCLRRVGPPALRPG